MSTTKTLATVALAGLLGAGIMTSSVANAAATDHADKAGTTMAKEKHACKGQNSCKGNGGDGKNDCKGKGSCATDGSK